MRRAFLITLASLALSWPARAEKVTLITPDGMSRLHGLQERVRSGALGADAVDARIDEMDDGTVRIQIWRKDGKHADFTLIPPRPQMIGGGFQLIPDDHISSIHVDRLELAIGDVLGPKPWIAPASPSIFWSLPGGDYRPVSAARSLFGSLFLFASMIAGFIVVAMARPAHSD